MSPRCWQEKRNLLLLLICLSPTIKGNAEVHNSRRVTDFNDYIEILQQTLDFRLKLRLIEAIWGEIRSDFVNDLDKTGELYLQLKHATREYLQTQKELLAAEDLKHQLANFLVSKYSEQLVPFWSLKSGAYSSNSEQKDLLLLLVENYDGHLLKEIFIKTVDKVYDAVETHILAAHLHQIFSEGNSLSFEAQATTQLHLFWKFQNRHEVNQVYLFNIAYYFHKMQKHSLYLNLFPSLQNRLEKAIKALPESLRNLFFTKEFCLLNQAYEEFIYTTNAIDIDEQRRYIFMWGVPNVVGSNGAWSVNITEIPTSNALQLQIAFRSVESRMFMYLEPKVKTFTNLVAAWRDGTTRNGSAWWSVELLDDETLIIAQNNDQLMCASEEMFDGRRFVYGRHDEQHNAQTSKCKWLPKSCP